MTYRLRLWPAAVPARLLFSLADTSRCFQPQTLCLPFWTCYTPDPTFPFGAKHSVWHKTFLLCAGLHSYLCLKQPMKLREQTEAAGCGLPVLESGHRRDCICCSMRYKPGPDVEDCSKNACLAALFFASLYRDHS